MSESELRKKCRWWWRERNKEWTFDPVRFTTKLKPTSENYKWKERYEQIVWWYELARRHARDDQWPPYPELTDKTRYILSWLEDFSAIRPHRKVLRVDEIPVGEDFSISRKDSWSGFF